MWFNFSLIGFLFMLLGVGSRRSQSHQPRRVSSQGEIPSKCVSRNRYLFCYLWLWILFVYSKMMKLHFAVEILLATSAARPRADVAFCIHALSRRLAKTRNWTVVFLFVISAFLWREMIVILVFFLLNITIYGVFFLELLIACRRDADV